MRDVKAIVFLGDSRERLRDCPKEVRHEVGVELRLIQNGENPRNWKPMSGVGSGAIEICVKAGKEYRVFTVAKFEEAIYVLHVFVKKSRQTPPGHIDIAKKRFKQLKEERK